MERNVSPQVQQVLDDACQIGYDAYRACVFVGNPFTPDNPLYDHWADGYWMGVEQAREEQNRGLTADNDN